MFSDACTIARNFTLPVIISHRNHKGECQAGIGTYVIINDEGWFVTAYHIIKQMQALVNSNKEYKSLLQKRSEIENRDDLKKHIKMQQLNQIKISPLHVTSWSPYFGIPNVKLGTIHILPEVDLAVGQILGFDKSTIKVYPKFMTDSKVMTPGRSLCKLGFPFHNITPTFEEGKGFRLPDGSLPIPLFPLDGIYTRIVEVKSEVSRTYPLRYVETSTPGLRGQSGGPTFDTTGAIWAIQSQTRHLKLGFGDSQQNTKEAEYVKNQYLNVGWGVHSETVTSFLKEKGIRFDTFST